MKKHGRYPIGKKIKYILDDFVSKGFFAQILLLVSVSFSLTLLFGLITMHMGEPNFTEGYWTSLMHMLDQGTIAGDEVGTSAYFTFMLFVTFVGMAFTGTTIAIITNAIQGKLDELKKGRSAIIERNHMVVLGFDANACTICHEIIVGSQKSGERVCLVVADDLSKETIEQGLKEYHENPQHFLEIRGKNKRRNGFKVLSRTGSLISENTFEICAVEKARAIVINQEDDLETIRILLALVPYLKKKHAYIGDDRMPSVVALIHEKTNLSAAKTAAGITFGENAGKKQKNEYKVRILNDTKSLGHLFAQSCIHQGLPYVIDGLFNYWDASINIENNEGTQNAEGENPLIGKTLPEIAKTVANAIPIGFVRKNDTYPVNILLNPPETEHYQSGDQLIYLSRDPKLNLSAPKPIAPVGIPASCGETEDEIQRNFLFIGWSDVLPDVLKNVGSFCKEGSLADIIAPETRELPENNIRCRRICCPNPYCWADVERILAENAFWFDAEDARYLTNIVILSQDGTDKVRTDEQIMVLLLNIRQYLKDRKLTDIRVISEMHLPQDQMLLQNDSGNDFVVVSEISYRMMVHILEDPKKYYLIKNLLQSKSSMIRLNPLSDYADTAQDFNFEGIFRLSAARKTEIPLGWLRFGHEAIIDSPEDENAPLLVLNPSEEDREKLRSGGKFDNYRLVVLIAGH